MLHLLLREHHKASQSTTTRIAVGLSFRHGRKDKSTDVLPVVAFVTARKARGLKQTIKAAFRGLP